MAREVSDAELAALIAKAQAGDRQALAEAMDVLDPLLLWLCRQFMRKQTIVWEPDDIVQEARAEALEAILNYDTTSGMSPRSVAVFAARRRLNLVLYLDRHWTRNISLYTPVEDEREEKPLLEIGLPELSIPDDKRDTEIEDLLDKMPAGLGCAESSRISRTLNRLSQTPNTKLPPDEELIALIEEGRTVAELCEMFGVTPDHLRYRVKVLRRSGRHVPHFRKKDRPHRPVLRVPWEVKRQIIADFFRENPGAGYRTAAKVLGMGSETIRRARRELAALGGEPSGGRTRADGGIASCDDWRA
ncbi:sigma factor [Symbiobacterium thermophilum]|uniref:Uncharacterized protein n=1 Tax=Symbiobacterium thermophilum TaxID=2734 RepID=A0A953LJ43_SYMTR|nr:sigma factor [Symbiobacterium thermophilum]MBY6275392.1 hypothetical protein [Symbiobacterium thermophilum]